MIKNEATVKITGWLNNVTDFEWGRALKISVDVRKQNHQGEWETVDKTVYDVTTDDRRGNFEHVKQVIVEGRITGTNVFQKRDGTTGFSIKVRGTSITPASEKILEAAIMETWPTVTLPGVDQSVPF
jgi:hypothetical protein